MRTLQTLLLSLLFHFSIFSLSLLLPEPTPKTANVVEVNFIPTSEKTKSVVRQTASAFEDNEELKKKTATALSRDFVRVKEETRAQATGLSMNRNPAGPSTKAAAPQNTEQKFEMRESDSNLQKQAREELQKSNQPFLDLPSGLSTVSEILPSSIAVGTMTALNTDTYKFYSFFMRVEEIIRFRWETSVYQALRPFPNQNRYTSEFSTELEVWLYPNGNIHSVRIFKRSGFEAFDLAASQAFVTARVLPNPPKELISESGFIRLKYGFVVRTPQRLLAQPN